MGGGWMPYQRVRDRSNLRRKPDDDPDPYFREADPRSINAWALEGDLNRMERDYLTPVYPEPPFAQRWLGSDPTSEVVTATGVARADVLKVLRFVFRGEVPTPPPPESPPPESPKFEEATSEYCALSQRVDGKKHSWTFDGDNPYIVCAYCKEMRDALDGRVITPGRTEEFPDDE